jgi:hypothetical protein
LNPKKSKLVTKKVASELSVPEELVDDLYSFYWEVIRKHLGQVDHVNITIDNLGAFEIKPVSLDKTISKYQNHVNKFDRTSFKSFPLYEKMRARLEVLEKAKQLYSKEREEHQQFKLKRHDKELNRDMEGEG